MQQQPFYTPQFHHCYFEVEKDAYLLANRKLTQQLQEHQTQLQTLRERYIDLLRAQDAQRRKKQEKRALQRLKRLRTTPPAAPAPLLPTPPSPTTEAHLKVVFGGLQSLQDLLRLRDLSVNPSFLANAKFRRLLAAAEAVEQIESMVGLRTLKKRVFDMVCYYSQFRAPEDLMHIVIDGPPGVGKSRFGEHLAHLMLALGVLPSKKFVSARRSELIAGYLGQSAIKTQAKIDSAMGGVLFLDEAYSLGEPEHRDSFSKECLDTLTDNLTRNRGKFLCVVAGYSHELEQCFFGVNRGLERRFPVAARMTIDGYSAQELFGIFEQMARKAGWQLPSDTAPLQRLFEERHADFRFFGGDVETLLAQAKMLAARRIMQTSVQFEVKPCLLVEDVLQAHDATLRAREKARDVPSTMYV